MAANRANIELINLTDGIGSPYCQHGPTLLFERFDHTSKKPRQFYACSAFRDRKSCNFFQWADQKCARSACNNEHNSTGSHAQMRKRYLNFKRLPRSDRHICCTCGLLLLQGELDHHETNQHTIKRCIGLKELRHPSFLFSPKDSNKTYAQYLFSKGTVDFLMDTLGRLGYTHLLCVGTPRIHEEVQAQRKLGDTTLASFLLDLDERYAQMYPPSLFTKYNMFNHHFFEDKGLTKLTEFLADGGGGVMLVTDPPFGGMVEALSATFRKISDIWNCMRQDDQKASEKGTTSLPMVWFFPYFMEGRIVSQFPSISMLDYKVDYDNHTLFNNQHKKKGSPVRIFTNISPELFILPEKDGYWFCQFCKRYSAKENQHCKECRACTSKDGTSYVHCDVCMRCVKPSRVHCFTCQMCQLKDHVCGKSHSEGCYICGEPDHKRRECPQRESQTDGNPARNQRGQKRKASTTRKKDVKKKRKNGDRPTG